MREEECFQLVGALCTEVWKGKGKCVGKIGPALSVTARVSPPCGERGQQPLRGSSNAQPLFNMLFHLAIVTKQTSKQNITKDVEIKNKLTITRGAGVTGERRGKVKSRNMYKGPMDKAKGGKD